MSKIPPQQEALILRVFYQAVRANVFRDDKEAKETQLSIKKDFRTHGRIVETRDQWERLLSKCSPDIAEQARLIIPVASDAELITRSARRFASSAALPLSIPSVAIDMDVVEEWLDDLEVKGHPRVVDLTPEQKDTLARVARKNRGIALRLVKDDHLFSMTPIGPLLDKVRNLMIAARQEGWLNFFTDKALFSLSGEVVRSNLHLLDYASSAAVEAWHRGKRISVRTPYNVVLPPELRTRARRYLEKSLGNVVPKLDDLFNLPVMVDVLDEGDRVVEVAFVGSGGVAFAPPRKVKEPERYAIRQLLGYKIIALALEKEARSVEIALYGGTFFDIDWARRMEGMAKEAGLNFVVFHVDTKLGRPRITELYGTRLEPLPHSGSPISHSMPKLRPPRKNLMVPVKVSPPAEEPSSVAPLESFSEMLRRKGAKYPKWVSHVRNARRSKRIPLSTRQVISELLVSSSKAEEGLDRLHRTVLDDLELIRSEIDETIGQVEELDDELNVIGSIEEINNENILVAVEGAISELSDRHKQLSQFNFIERWESIEPIAALARPDMVESVLGKTADELWHAYGEVCNGCEEMLKLQGQRLDSLKQRISSRKKYLEFTDVMAGAKSLIETAQTYLDEMNKEIDGTRRSMELRFNAIGLIDVDTPEGKIEFIEDVSRPGPSVEVVSVTKTLLGEIAAAKDHLKAATEGFPADDHRRAQTRELFHRLDEMAEDLSRLDDKEKEFESWHKTKWKAVRRKAIGLESDLEVPESIELPTALNGCAGRLVEGKGTLVFRCKANSGKSYDYAYKKIRRKFIGASVLVIQREAFMIDDGTVGEVKRWRKKRLKKLAGVDLLGREYTVAPHTLGVRIASIDELGERSIFWLARVLMDYIWVMGGPERDFVYTIANDTYKSRDHAMWRTLFATLLRDADEVYASDPKIHIARLAGRIQAAALALHDDVMNHPVLRAQAARWYEWGGAYPIRPIEEINYLPAELKDRAGSMQIDEMAAEIKRMGLLPKAPADFRGFISAWRDAIITKKKEMYESSMESGILSKKEVKTALRYDIKRLDRIPEPFVYVRSILFQLNSDPLTMRFGFLKRQAEKEGLDLSHFALNFLIDHQDAIVKGFECRGYVENSNGYVSRVEGISRDDIFEHVRSRSRLHEIPDEKLKEWVELGNGVWEAFGKGFGDAQLETMLLITGALAEFGEASLFQEYYSEMITVMVNVGEVSEVVSPLLSEANLHIDFPRSMAVAAGHFWYQYESLLDLEPVEPLTIDAIRDMMRQLGKKFKIKWNGGGGGAVGGSPSKPTNGASGPSPGGALRSRSDFSRTFENGGRMLFQPWMRFGHFKTPHQSTFY